MNDDPVVELAAEISTDRIPVSASTTVWLAVTLLSYLLLLLWLSIRASKEVKTDEDYLVAGRRLPLFLCWGALIATWFGADTMLATSESARAEGLRGVILDPFACSATLIYTGLFFAQPMWRMKLLTTSDFFRRTYGSTAEWVGACLQIPAYFGWIAVQFKALGGMQAVYFGIPVEVGILVACGVTLAYTMIGGMWSVTLTDTVQIVLAFLGLLVLAYTTFSQFGGGSAWAGLDRLLTETDPEFLTLLPPLASVAVVAYAGTWISGTLGNVSGQDLQQRIFSARDPKTAQWACILAGVIYLLFAMIPVSLGLISRLIDAEESGDILQVMARKYLSPAMAVLFVLSFTSVVLSTATSAVLAPATILSHNLLSKWEKLRERPLLNDRLCVLLIALGGLSLAFSDQSNMELLEFAISMQLVALYVPLHMGLYGRPRAQAAAIIPMLAGMAFYMARWLPENVFLAPPETFSGEYGDYLATRLPLLSPQLWNSVVILPAELYGLGASLLAYLIVQYVHRRRPPINDQTWRDAWGADVVLPV